MEGERIRSGSELNHPTQEKRGLEWGTRRFNGAGCILAVSKYVRAMGANYSHEKTTAAIDLGCLAYLAFFVSVLSDYYLPSIPLRWVNLVPDKLLLWPIGTLVLRDVNLLHMNDEQLKLFKFSFVMFSSLKAAALLLPLFLLIRKPLGSCWRSVVVGVAVLCPFLLCVVVGLGLVLIEHRWTLHHAIVLPVGAVNVYVLRGLAMSSLSLAKRVLYSLPCWLVWFLWLNSITHDWRFNAVPALGLLLYAAALQSVSPAFQRPAAQ